MTQNSLLIVAVLLTTAIFTGCASNNASRQGLQPSPETSPRTETDLLTTELAQLAPALNHSVLHRAVAAMHCATRDGAEAGERLAVIDFSLPSSEHRLWIFDLASKSLILEDFVAHGKGSGQNMATVFSNVEGSHQSSLGLFRTAESYYGAHGYSLRMDGLEQGANDLARMRAIVIHGAKYVDPSWIPRQGRIGRSHGCPAVRPDIAELVVDQLKDGQFLFAYYPDEQWLSRSTYLNCPGNPPALQVSLND